MDALIKAAHPLPIITLKNNNLRFGYISLQELKSLFNIFETHLVKSKILTTEPNTL